MEYISNFVTKPFRSRLNLFKKKNNVPTVIVTRKIGNSFYKGVVKTFLALLFKNLFKTEICYEDWFVKSHPFHKLCFLKMPFLGTLRAVQMKMKSVNY